MKSQLIIALKFLLVMTILTGVIYPFLMTGLSQLVFPAKANGSLILKNGKVVGSDLIGQKFDTTIYFWSRPSAIGYNPVPSGASNYGPTSDALKKLVGLRRGLFANANSVKDISLIPKEMIFASGSGLDPQISPEAALMQVDRIVKARSFSDTQKENLLTAIKAISLKPQFYILGEPRINVLNLNIILDNIGEGHFLKPEEK